MNLRAGFLFLGVLCAGVSVAQRDGVASPTSAPAAHLGVDPFVTGRVLDASRVRGFKAEVAHRIFTAEEGGELAIAALAVPMPVTGATADVFIFVEIDGASLLSHNRQATVAVEIYTYAVDVGGAVAGHLAQAVELDATELTDGAVSGLKFYGRLAVPAGSYDLRILVRDPRSGADGMAVVPFQTAEGSSPVLVPILPEPEARWLGVRQSNSTGDYPFLIDGLPLSPAARPVLGQGRELSLHLFGRGLTDRPLAGDVQFLEPGSQPPRVVAETSIAAVDPAAGSPDGVDRRTVRFRLPELAPGEYPLRLVLRDPAGGASKTAEVAVWVLAEDARERGLLWTDLRWMISGGRPGSHSPSSLPEPATRALKAPEPARSGRGRRMRRSAERYRTALAELAKSPLAETRVVVLDLESSVLGRGSDRLGKLQAAEIHVAGELAQIEADALLPLLAAHLELYRTYRDRRLQSLAAHSRILVEVLAELYAERGGTAELAAHVLASLGGYLQQSDLTASSQRLFQRALVHAPDHRGALLGLAASYEKYSKYDLALPTLEQLVEAHPDFAEGRLRLAVNLDRLGMKRRARELLSGIVESRRAAPWVRALAYQQLARRQLESGGYEQAAELLEAATVEVPGEPGPYHLLAYVHDRQRRPEEALRLLSEVRQLAAGSANGSAIKVYDSWPRGTLDDGRRALSTAAEQHRSTLAATLAGDHSR
ncbi:MAG: hypothetical protein GY719_30410 [bacterium]|nr:hypothetical protein [bacterium]